MKIGGFMIGFAAGVAFGVGIYLLQHHADGLTQDQPLAALPTMNVASSTGEEAAGQRFSSHVDRAVTERIRLASVNENLAMVGEYAELAKLEDLQKRERLLGKLFQAWVVRDAAGAAEFALGIGDKSMRREALLQVTSNWAIQDPDAALKWAVDAKYETDYERQMATSMICTEVARTDPKEALRLAQDYRIDERNDEILPNLTRRWAELDASAASDWVVQQPPGEKRDRLILSIAETLVNNSPTRAAKFILQQIPPGEGQNQAVLSILPQWALVDMPGAKAWAELFPEGSLRDRAMEALNGVMFRYIDDSP
jgi:hypothetical protein